MDSVKKVTARI